MTLHETCELLCIDAAKASELRGQLPSAESLEQAAESARALADPTRLALALTLANSSPDECCVCDLAFVVGRSDKLVSHHLRQLRAAGLAGSRKDGRMVQYSLTDQGLALLSVVGQLPERAR